MGLKIHPREEIVRAAEIKLREAVLDIVTKNEELTALEQLRVIHGVMSDWIGSFVKYGIRDERHGDTNKPGGLEWAACLRAR